jgi:hypothetical protein
MEIVALIISLDYHIKETIEKPIFEYQNCCMTTCLFLTWVTAHLTATTLALHSPEVPFTKMQIYNLQLNAQSLESTQLGSIDLLRKNNIMLQTDFFGGKHGPERVAAIGDLKEIPSVKDVDLCVMNPPFTRSVGENYLS